MERWTKFGKSAKMHRRPEEGEREERTQWLRKSQEEERRGILHLANLLKEEENQREKLNQITEKTLRVTKLKKTEREGISFVNRNVAKRKLKILKRCRREKRTRGGEEATHCQRAATTTKDQGRKGNYGRDLGRNHKNGWNRVSKRFGEKCEKRKKSVWPSRGEGEGTSTGKPAHEERKGRKGFLAAAKIGNWRVKKNPRSRTNAGLKTEIVAYGRVDRR